MTSFGGCNSPYKFSTKAFSDGQRIWKNRSSIVGRCLHRVLMAVVLVLTPSASLAIFGSDKWEKCDFSILILAIWHLHTSIDHIKAVQNHYFTAGLDMFLPTFNSSKCVSHAENRHSARGEGDHFLPRPFLFASGYGKVDQALLGDAFNGFS